MALTRVECGFPECDYISENASEQVALMQFQSHMAVHQQSQVSRPATTKQKLPPIERPKLKQDINEEEWDTFTQEWKRFKRCTSIPMGQEADQLFDCCERSLGRLLLKEDPNIIDTGETALLGAMKKMAVIKVATSVRRTKLLSLKQDHGQSIREFYANVKAQAATCNFSAKCGQTCCAEAPDVDYTPHVVKDILVSGISDAEIRRDVLEWPELDTKSAKDLVGFIEGKETAKNAWAGQSPLETAGVSSYKKSNKQEEPDTKTKLSLKAKCAKCGVQISQFTRSRIGRVNRTPYTKCIKCHKESIHDDRSDSKVNATSDATTYGFVSTVTLHESPKELDNQTEPLSSPKLCVNTGKLVNQVALDHHIFTQDGWRRASSLSLYLTVLRCM